MPNGGCQETFLPKSTFLFLSEIEKMSPVSKITN